MCFSNACMVKYDGNNVRIGFLVGFLKEKVYLYLIAGALVQKLFFHDGDGGHLGYISIYDNLASNLCQNQSPSG